MAQTIKATYDGKTFVPKVEINLPEGTDVTVIVDETDSDAGEGRYLFLRAAMAAKLQGPPDWSRRLDEYLYHGRTAPELEDE